MRPRPANLCEGVDMDSTRQRMVTRRIQGGFGFESVKTVADFGFWTRRSTFWGEGEGWWETGREREKVNQGHPLSPFPSTKKKGK
jgi:hypothetical protein